MPFLHCAFTNFRGLNTLGALEYGGLNSIFLAILIDALQILHERPKTFMGIVSSDKWIDPAHFI